MSEKLCKNCNTPFEPKAPNEQRCPECRGIVAAARTGDTLPAKVSIESAGAAPNLEILALKLLSLSGCEELTCNYKQLLIQINKK